MKKILSILLVLMLLLCGCEKEPVLENSQTDTESEISTTVETDMFTARDYEVGYDEENSVNIFLNGDSASSASDSVQISGTTVTIKEEATYIISGTLNDGMIIVDADDTAKLQLVLKGANINSSTSAPIYILNADKVFVTLATDTENTLSNGGTFTAIDDNNIDATIFSKQDITFNGSGSLTVTSPIGHGIISKDDLVITSGNYTINTASQGLGANDSVRLSNLSININSGKDGIHAENTDDTSLGFVYIASGDLTINSQGDGISASAYMQIEDGNYNITTGGGSINATKKTSDSWGGFMGGGRPDRYQQEITDTTTDSTSVKALKSSGNMVISNGTFTINSADDSIHSNASITVNGGQFNISSGDDAFHADETLTINSGTINITESYEGLEGLNITVNGGDIKLVATDDGLNCAGGTDESGFGGVRGNDQFGGHGMGGPGGTMSASSNGTITISGGSLYINASGDGIDANGSISITGGHTTVCGPTRGDTATLDYDTTATISGGTFIGTGASGMAQTFSDSKQGVIAVSVGNQSANSTFTITDKKGNKILEHSPELDYAVIIFSNKDIVSGETYTINIGSTSGEITAD